MSFRFSASHFRILLYSAPIHFTSRVYLTEHTFGFDDIVTGTTGIRVHNAEKKEDYRYFNKSPPTGYYFDMFYIKCQLISFHNIMNFRLKFDPET